MRARHLLATAALAVAVALPRAAHAQIVDVQSLIGRDVPECWSGKLEAGLDWRTGNTRLFRAAGAMVARYRRHDHLWFAVVRGEYAESAGKDQPLVTSVSKTFEHVRYRWQVLPRLAAEAFVQNEADRFRRLRVRALAGAGPRVLVAGGAAWDVHVGLAYMIEYEQLVEDGLAGAGDASTTSRLSSYAVATYAVNDKVTASETVYAQPRLLAPSDLRLLSELALATALNTHLGFRVSFVVAHDSRPPPDTARTDTSLQVGITVSF